MLRNHYKSELFLKHLIPATQQQQRQIYQQNILFNKSTNVSRQGKIMGKLFGHRVSGSKKHWFPSTTTDAKQAASQHVLFKQSQFGKVPSGGDRNVSRRMTVLNKLFMKHITDLMATGEISENIMGKGLQVSRVKVSQDFAHINVFWMSSCDVSKDSLLEEELQRCSGLLRHELSQLHLMGTVPRIKFVKDKLYSNMYQVENILRNMDFGHDEDEQDQIDERNNYLGDVFKQEFYGNKTSDESIAKPQEFVQNDESVETLKVNMPAMRHDVLGLDHKGIMLKILTKMRKSKQAWDQHLQNTQDKLEKLDSSENNSTIPAVSFNELSKVNEKLAKAAANSDKFEAFLAKRKERRNTPERKKFRISDHLIDDFNSTNDSDYYDQILSKRQLQHFEAEDYLYDDVEDGKLK